MRKHFQFICDLSTSIVTPNTPPQIKKRAAKGWAAGERGGSAGGGSGSRLLRRGLIIIIETIRTLRGAAEPLMVE